MTRKHRRFWLLVRARASIAGGLSCITLLFLLAGCDAQSRYSFSQPVMGGEAQLIICAASESQARAAAQSAYQRLDELNSIMSDYQSDSELMRLSRSFDEDIPVSDELYAVLLEAQQMAARSNGAFDVTVGPVIALWREAMKTGEAPAPSLLEQARESVGWHHLVLNPSTQCARLTAPDMSLDLGGIGKGFAADQVLALLKSRGLPRVLVNLGGDIAAGQPPPGREAWIVTVDAAQRSGSAANAASTAQRHLRLKNRAVATSGPAFRSVEIDGTRYSHIIDPRAGEPLTTIRSVTVVAPDATTADALASAISVLGVEDGYELLRHYPGAAALVTERVEDEIVSTWIGSRATVAEVRESETELLEY